MLAGIDDIHKSLYEFEILAGFDQTTELAALDCLKNPIDF